MKVESKQRIVTPKYTITVWRSEDSDYEHSPRGVSKLDVVANSVDSQPMHKVAETLLTFERVVRVEVLDWDRNGISVTKEAEHEIGNGCGGRCNNSASRDRVVPAGTRCKA